MKSGAAERLFPAFTTLMTALALTAIVFYLTATRDAAGVEPAPQPGEYAAGIGNCEPSLEQWYRRQAAGGDKIIEEHIALGAIRELTIRWDSGTVQRVTIGPIQQADGSAAICVLARRHIGTAESAPTPAAGPTEIEIQPNSQG